MAPDDVQHAVAKVRDAGNQRVIVTERGTSFGYHNLVVDMRAFPMMREQGVPVVFDVTHSLQLPGGGDGVTAGLAQYIEPLASAGVAAGVDGIFLEVHEDPTPRHERCAERAAPRPARAAAPPAGGARRDRQAAAGRACMADLALARRVLETEAAAILALLPRLDERFDRAVDPAARVPRPRHPHRHGQVRHHLPEDRGDAVEHRHAGVLSASGRSDPRRPRASSSGTTSSWRCRTAARRTRFSGCSRRSAGWAPRSSPSPACRRRRSPRLPTSRSTAASPKKPVR